MKIKELKGDYGFWIDYNCRPQAKSEELSCDVDVLGLLTNVVIDGDRMNTFVWRMVELTEERPGGGQGARGTIMAKLDAKAECL